MYNAFNPYPQSQDAAVNSGAMQQAMGTSRIDPHFSPTMAPSAPAKPVQGPMPERQYQSWQTPNSTVSLGGFTNPQWMPTHSQVPAMQPQMQAAQVAPFAPSVQPSPYAMAPHQGPMQPFYGYDPRNYGPLGAASPYPQEWR